MAIADAASTPKTFTAISTATNVATLAAAFTPPNNSLLVAMAGFVWNTAYSGSPTFTISDSLAGSWTNISQSNAGASQSAASIAAYRTIGTGASMTVSATWSGDSLAKTRVLCVAVLTGAAATGTIAGSLFTGGSSAGANTWAIKTVTTTTPGSLVLSVMTYDANRTVTVNGNTTEYVHLNDGTVASVAMAGRATSLTTTPGSLAIGWTLSGTGTNDASGEVVEIMPAAAAGGPIQVVQINRAVMRASLF